MMIKVIKTCEEYEKALAMLEELLDANPELGTENADKLELLTLLISSYEKENFPMDLPDPIEAVKFRMEQQQLSPRDLIPYIGSRSKVSEVLARKRPLTIKMIRALNKGLEIPLQILLKETGAEGSDNLKFNWKKFPLNEMAKRHWFPGFSGSQKEAREKAEELLKEFFKSADPSVLQPALFRKTLRIGSTMDIHALMAWCVRVLNVALDNPINSYYKSGTITLKFLRELVKLSYMEKGPLLAVEFLKKNGIRVIVEPHLPKTHLDGAAMQLPGGIPVVALTLRHDRIDNFWFCLCHELSHIALHFEKNGYNCFLDDLDSQGNDLEEEADTMARDVLIPPEAWENSPARLQHFPEQVLQLAEQLQIHPAIVAGRIRWQQKNYRLFSRLIGNGEVRKLFK
ncbi:MAG: ImmA/IrrE family metallo-endopeptidase [Acidobacteria bacterium]|nr:ImmA/IrrE family metallo-endopeptidase [Acidobacteriota bacterium]